MNTNSAEQLIYWIIIAGMLVLCVFGLYLFTYFPSGYKEKAEWVTQNWTKTPSNSADSVFRVFALNEVKHFGVTEASKLDKVEMVLWQALDKQSSYYACRAKYDGDHVWNIDFYILSLDKGWLVAIYSDM